MLRSISSLVFLSIVLTTTAHASKMGKCYPKKNDFHGSEISTTTARWQMNRSRNTGGATKAHKMRVPNNRVVVQWDVKKTSCNSRCTSPSQVLIFKDMGAFKIPNGVSASVRWKKDLRLFGPGGIYSGNATMLHVSISDWKKVFMNKYFGCS